MAFKLSKSAASEVSRRVGAQVKRVKAKTEKTTRRAVVAGASLGSMFAAGYIDKHWDKSGKAKEGESLEDGVAEFHNTKVPVNATIGGVFLTLGLLDMGNEYSDALCASGCGFLGSWFYRKGLEAGVVKEEPAK